MRPKPTLCTICPGYEDFTTTGFVPADSLGKLNSPDIDFAVLCEAPGETEALTSVPLTGATGQLFEAVLNQHGLSWDNVIRDNVIRCRPKDNEYPRNGTAASMERNCRQWDTVIDAYSPDVVIICWHPTYALIRVPSEAYTVHDCIEKALRLGRKGHRPLIAMGVKSVNLLLPNLGGPVANFGAWVRSHFFVEWTPTGLPRSDYEVEIDQRVQPKKISFASLKKPFVVPLDEDVPF